MIQFLSLVLSFLLLFFAGSSLPAQSGSAQVGHEVKDCCRQEAAEENTADCCKKETTEETVPDCCKQENAEKSASDCCGGEAAEEKDCCRQETTEAKVQDNIPDCCGN